MSTAIEPARAAKVGRPRTTQRPTELTPLEEILDASARLFSTVGYSTTTTRENILAELLDRTVEPATAFLSRLSKSNQPADVKLFTLVRRDVENLCAGPYNLAKLQLLPEATMDRFGAFWAKRAALQAGYGRLVREAAVAGHLDVDDAELATDLLFGLVESVIGWFERDGTRRGDEVAIAMATAGLRSLGATNRRLAAIAPRSHRLLAALA
jgi:Tetracyclin repressor-like, C-terminal domain